MRPARAACMCSWVLVAARAWMRLRMLEAGWWRVGGGVFSCRVCVCALCGVSCVWEAQRGWCMPSPAACTETFGETGEPRHHLAVERAGAYVILLCRCVALLALRGELQPGGLLLAAPFILLTSTALFAPWMGSPSVPAPTLNKRLPLPVLGGFRAWVSACGCPGECL